MQVISVAALLLVVAVAMANADGSTDEMKSVEDLWASWKTTHKKTYATPEEDKRRFEVFKDNKQRIDEHNKKYEKGEVTYTMGLNHFSDLTAEEFKNRHTAPLPVRQATVN